MPFMEENGEYYISNEINFAMSVEDDNLMQDENTNEEEEILINQEESIPIELPS